MPNIERIHYIGYDNHSCAQIFESMHSDFIYLVIMYREAKGPGVLEDSSIILDIQKVRLWLKMRIIRLTIDIIRMQELCSKIWITSLYNKLFE